MTDEYVEGTFEEYARALDLLGPGDEKVLSGARAALGKLGLKMSAEEMAIRLGLLKPPQVQQILTEIRNDLNISIRVPSIRRVDPAKERATRESMIPARLKECLRIKEQARQIGVTLTVTEILNAKGRAAPAAAKPPVPTARTPMKATSAPPKRAGKQPVRRRERPEPGPRKKGNGLVLGLSIGGGIAAVVAVAIIALTSGGSGAVKPKQRPRTAPKSTVQKKSKLPSDAIFVWSADGRSVPVYTESELLDLHVGRAPARPRTVTSKTSVTLHGKIRSEKNLWYRIRAPGGADGWVAQSALKTTKRLENLQLDDQTMEWKFKLAARKGATLAVEEPKKIPGRPKPTPKGPEEPIPVPVEPVPVPVAPTPKPVMASSLVGHWDFNEGRGAAASDRSLKNNNGTLKNDPAWVARQSGQALQLDGKDDYVACGVSGLPPAGKPMSITAWTSIDSVPAGPQPIVFLGRGKEGIRLGFLHGKPAVWDGSGKTLVTGELPVRPTNGLLGTYYSDVNLWTPVLRRIDPMVVYDWDKKRPHSDVPKDQFSVRWTGKVEVPEDGTWLIHVLSDDGARLWVNGQSLIDQWTEGAAKLSTGRVELKAGTKHDLRLEYYDNKGAAKVALLWSRAVSPPVPIPTEQLFPPSLWNHLAYVYDGKDHVLYVNGNEAGRSKAAGGAGKAPDTLELGRGPTKDGYEHFMGSLDDVQIFAGPLSATKIRATYSDADMALAAAGKPDASPPGLPKPKGPPPPGPRPPSDPDRSKSETAAEALWTEAVELEAKGKLAAAKDKLRSLRARYRRTSFYFGHMIEISDKLNTIGRKLAVADLRDKKLYKKPHFDSWYGYEFRPPEGWHGIPPAKAYKGMTEADEAFYRGTTIRIARYTSDQLDGLYLQVFKPFAATTIGEVEANVLGIHRKRMEGLRPVADQPLIMGRDPAQLPFRRRVYKSRDGDRLVFYFYHANRRGLAMVGTWMAKGGEATSLRIISISSSGTRIVVNKSTKETPVTDKLFENALKIFDQAALTFSVYTSGMKRARSQQLMRGALCSDWNLMASSRGSYVLEYCTSKEYAKQAGDALERIFGLYKKVLPTRKPIPPCRVKIFESEEDFMRYAPMLGAAAYWSPGQEEIVCYKFKSDRFKTDSKEEFTIGEKRKPEEITFKVLYHEGFHQYIHYYMGGGQGDVFTKRVYVPSWLNEGLGDHFFGGEWYAKRGTLEIGKNEWRVKKIYEAVKADKHVPLEEIIRYQQADYYRNGSLCYAEGWAMCHFFLMSDVAKKKRWAMIPSLMISQLKKHRDWEKATDAVFAGIDMLDMEEEWKKFVLAMDFPGKEKEEEGPGGKK